MKILKSVMLAMALASAPVAFGSDCDCSDCDHSCNHECGNACSEC